MSEQIQTSSAAAPAPQGVPPTPAPAQAHTDAGQAQATASPPAGTVSPPPATAPAVTGTLLSRAASADTTKQDPTPPAGEARAQETAPGDGADLDIHIPEGMTPDAALIERFKPLAKELGLSGEKAQKLADLYVQRQQEIVKEAEAQKGLATRAWAEAVQQDPELGGAKFEKNMAVYRQAVEKFGGKGLFELLETTGLGSHPEVVRAFFRIGRLMQPDSIAGTLHAPPPPPAKKPWEILYQNSHFKEKR